MVAEGAACGGGDGNEVGCGFAGVRTGDDEDWARPGRSESTVTLPSPGMTEAENWSEMTVLARVRKRMDSQKEQIYRDNFDDADEQSQNMPSRHPSLLYKMRMDALGWLSFFK